MNNNTKKFIEDLRATAWRTSGARYSAARRLNRADLIATFSIASFSVVGIGLAVFQRIYTLPPSADNYVTAASILIGLCVLVISLIEWGGDNRVRADRLFLNAERLNQFQRKVGLVLAEIEDGDVTVGGKVDALRNEYENIKGECPCNHDPIDDQYFMAEHRLAPEFAKADGKPRCSLSLGWWARLRYMLGSGGKFAFFWLAVTVVIAMIPWSLWG